MSENDSNLSNLTEWLENLRKNEVEQSQRALAIIKKHLENADLPFRQTGENSTWSSVGWDLYYNIDKYLDDEKYSAMLKAMFAELVDFCETATSESFEYKLKILLEKFINYDLSRRKITQFLPEKALAQFGAIDRMLADDHERYMEILNQQGY